MNLTKKQVGALLKFMPSDGVRPAIEQLHIETYNGRTVAVALDGRQLVALYVDFADDAVGRVVKRDELVKWYKLATAKSRLDDNALFELLAPAETDASQFTDWQQLVIDEPAPATQLFYNADFLANAQQLNDNCIKYTIHPRYLVGDTEVGRFVVMTMKG